MNFGSLVLLAITTGSVSLNKINVLPVTRFLADTWMLTLYIQARYMCYDPK